jgi:hypothetical protein
MPDRSARCDELSPHLLHGIAVDHLDARLRERVWAHVAADHLPLVILLGTDGTDGRMAEFRSGKILTTSGATSDLLLQALLGVVGPDLLPMPERERGEVQDVGARPLRASRPRREPVRELVDHAVELRSDRVPVGLREDRAHERRNEGSGGSGTPRRHLHLMAEDEDLDPPDRAGLRPNRRVGATHA